MMDFLKCSIANKTLESISAVMSSNGSQNITQSSFGSGGGSPAANSENKPSIKVTHVIDQQSNLQELGNRILKL